jgi:hypothetical protein
MRFPISHVPSQARGRARCVRGAALTLSLTVVLCVAPARAIDIQVWYDANAATGIDPCTPVLQGQQWGWYAACAGGVDRTPELTAIVEHAADYWEDVFDDVNVVVTLRYFWHTDAAPDANAESWDVQGHPVTGRIRIPVDRGWYYDPDPSTDDGYAMEPKLYRTTHPDEQVTAFSGADEPPEVFEVAYNGPETAARPPDLLTTVLHEMGHALGLDPDTTAANGACEFPLNWVYDLDPSWVDGADTGLRAFTDVGSEDCGHLALGGITACEGLPDEVWCKSHQALLWPGEFPNHRARPGTADIFAVALGGNWQEVDLPHKFSLASGVWSNASTWLGDRVPDSGDDVYVVNRLAPATVSVFAPAALRNLLVADGNSVAAFSSLDVADTITLADAGTELTADAGSSVQATDLDVGEDALLDVPFGGFVDAFRIDNQGEIRGASTIDVVSLINAGGTIRSNGGPLSFTSSNFDPPFDLDGAGGGSLGGAVIEALTGNLSFGGALTDPVRADVRVGAGYTLTFAQGWTHEAGGSATLLLAGSALEAVIAGDSTLARPIEAHGLSRFTDDLTLTSLARLQVTLAGTTPGAGHTQVNVDGGASLDGTLEIQVEPGYFPGEGDEFVVLASPAVNGQFQTIQGQETGGGSFDVLVGPTEVRLVFHAAVGPVPDGGQAPGAPLLVDKAGGDITLSWSQPCTGQRDYEIYEGPIGSYYEHNQVVCSTGGQPSFTLTPGGPAQYYLVVPKSDYREGSYGYDGSGAERPPGIRQCLPQAVATCGPV